MKRIAIMALLLMTGTAYAQNKTPLIKVDDSVFEKQAKKVKQEDYNNMVIWAKEVFSQYCNNVKLQVSFTEADYKYAVDSIRKYYMPAMEAKDKLASEKTDLEKTVAEKTHIIDSLMNQVIIPLKKGVQNDSVLKSQIEYQNIQLDVQKMEIDSLKTYNTELSETNNQLVKNYEPCVELVNKYDTLVKKYQDVLNELKQQSIDNDILNRSINAYRAAFQSTEKTIDSIYNANRDMSLFEMNEDVLNHAITTFESIAFLLKTDPVLYDKLSQEVNEIKAWNALKKALYEGIDYMKGKYNNANREKCVNSIITAMKSHTLSDNHRNEVQCIIDNLNNQTEINKELSSLLNRIKDVIGLENTNEAKIILTWIKDSQNKLGSKLSNYHVKHKEAFDKLQALFTQATTDISKNKLNTVDGFEKAINDIKAIYQ